MTQTHLKEKAARFARRHDLLHGPAIHALDLVSEVGKVTKEILLATHNDCPFTLTPCVTKPRR